MRTVNIFDYTNFKSYLLDVYNDLKVTDSRYSYRYIAQKVGFKSAGHFTQILQGKIHLSPSLTAKFIEFLGLKKKEAQYFELMVKFDLADTHSEKGSYFEQILRLKKLKVATVNEEQFAFYDKWYYSALREIVAMIPVAGDDYGKLAKVLNPAITPGEAKKGIQLLEKLGLIKKNNKGFYEQVDQLISAQPDGKAIAITNQALQTMELAKESIDRFPKDERNVSGVAFGISKETFGKIQDEIRVFRKRILEIAKQDNCPDTVYQFNVQVFPLSNSMTTEGNNV